jgi:hypothetical protein
MDGRFVVVMVSVGLLFGGCQLQGELNSFHVRLDWHSRISRDFHVHLEILDDFIEAQKQFNC